MLTDRPDDAFRYVHGLLEFERVDLCQIKIFHQLCAINARGP
jgi:hypothetical protein